MRLAVTGATGYLGPELASPFRRTGLLDSRLRHPRRGRRRAGARALDAVSTPPTSWTGRRLVDERRGRGHRRPRRGPAPARLVHMSTDLVFDGSGRPGGYRREDPVPPPRLRRGPRPRRRSSSPAPIRERPDRPRPRSSTAARPPATTSSSCWTPPTPRTDRLLRRTRSARRSGRAISRPRSWRWCRPPERPASHLAGADAVSRYEFARLVAAAHGRDPDSLASARSADSGSAARSTARSSPRSRRPEVLAR